MSNQLAVVQENNLMPALTLDEAKYRYNALVEFTKDIMKKDKDYGVIPGTGTKPTLLKPGAEKLCALFGMSPEFELIDSVKDFEKGLFYFQYRCALTRGGHTIASGIGSCNSKEKKYRYRYVYENKATEEEKASAVSVETKSGKYGPYKVYKIENTETFDIVNTIDKMAQKRALVAAVLIGANASEFFTQDIEDLETIDGDFAEIESNPEPAKRPAKTQTAHTRDDATSKEYDFKSRPYDAETLRAALLKKAETIGMYDASDAQRNLLGALLNEYFQDDQKRHTIQLWLTGASSTKDMGGPVVKAMLDWLKPTKDDSGAYVIDDTAKTELSHVLTVALMDEGQLGLSNLSQVMDPKELDHFNEHAFDYD